MSFGSLRVPVEERHPYSDMSLGEWYRMWRTRPEAIVSTNLVAYNHGAIPTSSAEFDHTTLGLRLPKIRKSLDGAKTHDAYTVMRYTILKC